MAIEQLTYVALGERLGCSPEAARGLVQRLRLPRSKGNDGKTLVAVDVGELNHKPKAGRSSPGYRPDSPEVLKVQIAALELQAAGYRADYERERDRGDRLMDDAEAARRLADSLVAELTRLAGMLAERQRPWWWWRWPGLAGP